MHDSLSPCHTELHTLKKTPPRTLWKKKNSRTQRISRVKERREGEESKKKKAKGRKKKKETQGKKGESLPFDLYRLHGGLGRTLDLAQSKMSPSLAFIVVTRSPNGRGRRRLPFLSPLSAQKSAQSSGFITARSPSCPRRTTLTGLRRCWEPRNLVVRSSRTHEEL